MCLLKCKKSEHHHEKTSDCQLFHKDWLLETDLFPLSFSLVAYNEDHPVQDGPVSSSSPPIQGVPQLSVTLCNRLLDWMRSVNTMSFLTNQVKQTSWFMTPHFQIVSCTQSYLSWVSPALYKQFSQIFSDFVRASGQPNYLRARVPVPTHWDLDLLESPLEGYNDKLVVDLLCHGWPISRRVLPLTKGSAKVYHKGALNFQFPH